MRYKISNIFFQDKFDLGISDKIMDPKQKKIEVVIMLR